MRLEGHGEELEDETKEWSQCISTITFSPSGDRVLTAGWDGTAVIWDAQSGEKLVVLEGHTGRLVDAIFDPSGTLVATSSDEDRTVRLWDTLSGNELLAMQTTGTGYLDFSPDGSRLAAAGAKVWIWNTDTGEEHVIRDEDEWAFFHAVFSPDGKRIVATGLDGTGFVWDVETGEQTATLEGHTGEIWQIVYSSRGDMIATAGEDGTARLWGAESGQELFVLRGHGQTVWSVAFRPDGDQVATGGADGTVRLWNTQTGGLEAVLPDYVGVESLINWEIDTEAGVILFGASTPCVYHVSYSPAGDRVVAANTDGSVDIYVADAGKLLEIARSQVTRELTCEEREQFLYEDLDCH